VGEDSYRIEAAVAKIRRDVLGEGGNADFNWHVFRGGDASWQRALQQARSFPMLGSRQVVWLRDADAAIVDDAAGDAMTAYLAEPTEQSVFVVTAAKLDRRKRWLKAWKDAGVLYEIEPPTGRDLAAWTERAVRRAGLALGDNAIALLIELVGNDLRALSGEIEKLALIAEDTPGSLTEDTIVATVVDQAEREIYALNQQIGPDRAGAALSVWLDMAAEGQSAQRLAPLLLYKLRTATLVEALQSAGCADAEIPQIAGINGWVVRAQLKPLVRQLGRIGLRRGLVAALACDRSLKSSPVEESIHFERLIASVCQADIDSL
jgi:DNA polymerase-3 subunit delta